MAKGFVTRAFSGRVIAKATVSGKLAKPVAGSDLSQAAKREKVTKALSTGSKKSGTFEYHNAGKRA